MVFPSAPFTPLVMTHIVPLKSGLLPPASTLEAAEIAEVTRRGKELLDRFDIQLNA
jgi:hypothetical protein